VAGKVRWQVTMSLDGFIAGPDDAMDWIAGYSSTLAEEVIQTTGALLAGRRGYDIGQARGEKAYGGAWSGPQFVLTHRPADTPDPAVTFLRRDPGRGHPTSLAANRCG
jgi:dihydrofolate reductase